MDSIQSHSIFKKINDHRTKLTPKGRILGGYIIENARKVVFMTAKELAETSGVSEATVVRFVKQLGYDRYGAFLQTLREIMDSELTMLDRMDLTNIKGPDAARFSKVVSEEIDNLKQLFKVLDLGIIDRILDYLHKCKNVYVIGSRASYAMAHYMGWSLTKVRENVNILRGSDSTCIDWLTFAHPDSLVVIIAIARYPNELIQIGKLVRRLNHTLVVITDSATSPLIQFAHEHVIAPSRFIRLIGSPITISCIILYMVLELAGRKGEETKTHQEKLERSYLENDVLFNYGEDNL